MQLPHPRSGVGRGIRYPPRQCRPGAGCGQRRRYPADTDRAPASIPEGFSVLSTFKNGRSGFTDVQTKGRSMRELTLRRRCVTALVALVAVTFAVMVAVSVAWMTGSDSSTRSSGVEAPAPTATTTDPRWRGHGCRCRPVGYERPGNRLALSRGAVSGWAAGRECRRPAPRPPSVPRPNTSGTVSGTDPVRTRRVVPVRALAGTARCAKAGRTPARRCGRRPTTDLGLQRARSPAPRRRGRATVATELVVRSRQTETGSCWPDPGRHAPFPH